LSCIHYSPDDLSVDCGRQLADAVDNGVVAQVGLPPPEVMVALAGPLD